GVDGGWSPRMQSLPMTNSGQSVTVTVNPASAIWVNLTNNTVLAGSIISKTGAQNARLWSVAVTNNGTETATSSQIDQLTLTQTSGASCNPVVKSSLRVKMSDIPAGGSAPGSVLIVFTACAATARFTVNALFSANGGSATGVIVRNNDYR